LSETWEIYFRKKIKINVHYYKNIVDY